MFWTSNPMLFRSFSIPFHARSGADNPASRVIALPGRFLARERVTENLAGPARTLESPDGPVSSRGSVLVFVVEGVVDGVFEVVVEQVGHVGVLIVVVVVLVLSAHAPDCDYT